MNAIDRAVAHFNEQEIRSLSVEEWGDESGPLVIYAKPLTLNESQKLYKLSKNNELELLAYALIHKALDGNGDKMFTMDDKHKLLNNVDVTVMTRVGSWIMGTDDMETAEKK